MRNLIRVLTIGAILLLAIGCKEEELRLEGTGISEISWSKDMVADEDGEMLSLTFTAAGKSAFFSSPVYSLSITPRGDNVLIGTQDGHIITHGIQFTRP
jgi:hypothetical protein